MAPALPVPWGMPFISTDTQSSVVSEPLPAQLHSHASVMPCWLVPMGEEASYPVSPQETFRLPSVSQSLTHLDTGY